VQKSKSFSFIKEEFLIFLFSSSIKEKLSIFLSFSSIKEKIWYNLLKK